MTLLAVMLAGAAKANIGNWVEDKTYANVWHLRITQSYTYVGTRVYIWDRNKQIYLAPVSRVRLFVANKTSTVEDVTPIAQMFKESEETSQYVLVQDQNVGETGVFIHEEGLGSVWTTTFVPTPYNTGDIWIVRTWYPNGSGSTNVNNNVYQVPAPSPTLSFGGIYDRYPTGFSRDAWHTIYP